MESQSSPFRLIPFLGLVAIFFVGFAAMSYARSVYEGFFAASTSAINRAQQAAQSGDTTPSGLLGTGGDEDAEESNGGEENEEGTEEGTGDDAEASDSDSGDESSSEGSEEAGEDDESGASAETESSETESSGEAGDDA